MLCIAIWLTHGKLCIAIWLTHGKEPHDDH
jgi:hypothetical protein